MEYTEMSREDYLMWEKFREDPKNTLEAEEFDLCHSERAGVRGRWRDARTWLVESTAAADDARGDVERRFWKKIARAWGQK